MEVDPENPLFKELLILVSVCLKGKAPNFTRNRTQVTLSIWMVQAPAAGWPVLHPIYFLPPGTLASFV
jgi:hypothetical protein